jgi:hypothetical protein
MQLTRQQKLNFHRDGYIKISGAVPQRMVEQALRAINHSLGEEGMNKEDLPTLRSRFYCGEVQKDPAITDIFNHSPVFTLSQSLLGEDNVLEASAGQIALRFPTAPIADPGPPRGHLDGIGSGLNGQAKGQYRRGFTGLAVVLLSQLTGDYGGNFTVWPGSHTFFENHFKEHGHEILGEGMPKVDLPNEPVQITGEPGDAILAHHQIVHTAAPNASSHIRYATIFRLRHKDCDEIGHDAYTDIWREWPGIQAALTEPVCALQKHRFPAHSHTSASEGS